MYIKKKKFNYLLPIASKTLEIKVKKQKKAKFLD